MRVLAYKAGVNGNYIRLLSIRGEPQRLMLVTPEDTFSPVNFYIGLEDGILYKVFGRDIPENKDLQDTDQKYYWLDSIGQDRYDLQQWIVIAQMLRARSYPLDLEARVTHRIANGLIELFRATGEDIANKKFADILSGLTQRTLFTWGDVRSICDSNLANSREITVEQHRELYDLITNEVAVNQRKAIGLPIINFGDATWLVSSVDGKLMGCLTKNTHPDIKPPETEFTDDLNLKEIKRVRLKTPALPYKGAHDLYPTQNKDSLFHPDWHDPKNSKEAADLMTRSDNAYSQPTIYINKDEFAGNGSNDHLYDQIDKLGDLEEDLEDIELEDGFPEEHPVTDGYLNEIYDGDNKSDELDDFIYPDEDDYGRD